MKLLTKPLRIKLTDLPVRLSDIWFQHHSPRELDTLKPQSYYFLQADRQDDLGKSEAAKYIEYRKKTEKQYHQLLDSSGNKSFIYATIVGFNKMEPADKYPGFTYYFQLTPKQIENVVFELVAGQDESLDIKPAIGQSALSKCMKSWIVNYKKFKSYYSELVQGQIDPRIEVVIPFDVKPEQYFPEEEQR